MPEKMIVPGYVTLGLSMLGGVLLYMVYAYLKKNPDEARDAKRRRRRRKK
ncbi:MAG: hypothetical protein ACUZ8A_03060 [Candidatus Bathyanammoxibius sp.]